MTTSAALACVWILVATVVAMMPRRIHWAGAYALMAALVPLIPWLFLENSPWVGILFLLGVASMLRWPLRFLFRWLKARFAALTGQ